MGTATNHYYFVANQTIQFVNTSFTNLTNAAAVEGFYGPNTAAAQPPSRA